MSYTDTIKNLGEAITSVSAKKLLNNPLVTKILFWTGFVIGILALAAIAWFVWYKRLRYNIRVHVKKVIGKGGQEIIIAKARRYTDATGTRKIELMRKYDGRTITTAVPPERFRQKLGRNDLYEFLWDNEGRLQPILPASIDEAKLDKEYTVKGRVERADWTAWERQEQKAIEEKTRKRDKLEKYIMPVTVIIVATISLLMIIYAMKTAQASVGEMARECGRMLSTLSSIK